jgi:hypothetical protein
MQRQRHAERDGVLRQHQTGGFHDVVALDHPLCAGHCDRVNIGAAEAVLGLQVAHRFDRGTRGGGPGAPLEVDELLAEAAGQPAG